MQQLAYRAWHVSLHLCKFATWRFVCRGLTVRGYCHGMERCTWTLCGCTVMFIPLLLHLLLPLPELLPPLTCLPPSRRASAQRGLSWPNCTKQHPQCLRCLTAFKMPAILWHVIYLFCVCVCYASVPVESKLFGGRTGLFCFLLNLQKLHLTLRRDPPI